MEERAVYSFPGTTQSLQAHFCPLPETNWTRRAYHASIVVGDFVYIDGGEAAIGQQPYPSNGSLSDPTYDAVARAVVSVIDFQPLFSSNSTDEIALSNYLYQPTVNVSLSLPLAQSWTPDKVRYSVIMKPGMPLWNFQSLFYDEKNNSLLAFGGEISELNSLPPDQNIWKWNLNGGGGGTWALNSSFRNAPWNQGITRPLGGASKSTNSTGFLLGGYSSTRSSPDTASLLNNAFVPTPGLLTYTFDNGTWRNVTDTPDLSISGAIEWTGIEYVPFGPNGLMVVIGGETSDLISYTPGQKERSMTKITMFDPVTLQFYTQTATGSQTPSERNRFCIASVGDSTKASADSSSGSYEIYIYGGYGGVLGPGAEQYDEIWALTLPAFQWIQVDSSHHSARIGHTCHVVGKSQLLSIGGADAAQSDPWSTVDGAFQGLGTFDLNSWNWTRGYDADAPAYKRSPALEAFYSSNGAYPKRWDMPELRDLIMNNETSPSKSQPASSSPSTSASSASHLSTSASNGLSKYEKIGLSIGTVIGGLTLLICLTSLIYICLRRQRTQHSMDDNSELSGESNKHELASNPRIQGHKPASRRFLVELAGDEVALEKESGKVTPGGRSQKPTSPIFVK